MTCHQRCPVAFTHEQFHKKYHELNLWYVLRDLKITTTSSRGQWVKKVSLDIYRLIWGCDHIEIDGLMQERRNLSVLAMELCLPCTNPLKWSELWDLIIVINLHNKLLIIWSPNTRHCIWLCFFSFLNMSGDCCLRKWQVVRYVWHVVCWPHCGWTNMTSYDRWHDLTWPTARTDLIHHQQQRNLWIKYLKNTVWEICNNLMINTQFFYKKIWCIPGINFLFIWVVVSGPPLICWVCQRQCWCCKTWWPMCAQGIRGDRRTGCIMG